MSDQWNNGRSDQGESDYRGRRNYDNESKRGGYPNREFTNSNRDYRSRDSRSDDGSYKNEESSIMYVQPQHVGRIIGKGGSKIKELQLVSGARINIDKSSSGDVKVTLVGPENAQERAKELIEELTAERQDTYSRDDDRGRNRDQSGSRSRNYNNSEPQSRDNYEKSAPSRRNYEESAPKSHNYEETKSRSHEPRSRYNEPTPAPKAQESDDGLNFASDFDWTKASSDHQKFQKERWQHLKPMIKNFYNEDPQVTTMSAEEVARIRLTKNKIECRRVFEKDDADADEFKVPNPVLTFEQAFRDYPDVLREIRKQGFEEPSPIQCQAWPILLSGKDLIGIAQTGTGKTLAFLLPALIHIDGQTTPRTERVGPNVLVMAPTRELALQIKKEVDKYEYHGIKAVCVYGGGSRQEQIASVGRGVNIVIATPGRLNDLVMSGALNTSEVSYLVLDEADRMLDMGFEPQIRKALLDVRPDRQTVMTRYV